MIIVFIFIYVAVETSYSTNWYQIYVRRSWPLGSRIVTNLTFHGHVMSSVTWPTIRHAIS